MRQSEHELTRTQLIAKVEAEVDRFRWRDGAVSDLAIKEPPHDARQDCCFKLPARVEEPTKALRPQCAMWPEHPGPCDFEEPVRDQWEAFMYGLRSLFTRQ